MKNFEKFKTWLGKQGAEVLPPTNEWEVVRFRTTNGVSVIYTKANGRLTFTGESDKAMSRFEKGESWKIIDRKRQALRQQKARLASRDGKECFFCAVKHGNLDSYTVEHLLSFSHGGTDNINNLCLACEPCNTKVGNWPVVKKILYREQMRASTRRVIDVQTA